MTSNEWNAILSTWTREIAARDTENPNTPRTIDPVYGLGFPAATEHDISTAEARLGIELPPSYSEFLRAANGLLQP